MVEAMSNEHLLNGLRKIFEFDARMHGESAENEALGAAPNTNRIIQHAVRQRASREFALTIKTRLPVLTQQKR